MKYDHHITICRAVELKSARLQKMLLLERFKKNWELHPGLYCKRNTFIRCS